MKKIVAKSILIGLGSLLIAGPAFAGDWSGQVGRLVASKQSYPTAAQMRGDEGTAKVRVSVGADGTVQGTELVAGSGSALLDKEALSLCPRRSASSRLRTPARPRSCCRSPGSFSKRPPPHRGQDSKRRLVQRDRPALSHGVEASTARKFRIC